MTEFEEESPQPGLAAERTDLAWNRSGLALVACGVAIMRGLALRGLSPAHVGVGAVVLVLGGAVWALGALQARRRSRLDHGRERAEATDLLPIAIGTAAVGVAAFILGAFFPG
jgi:putative membrane protein